MESRNERKRNLMRWARLDEPWPLLDQPPAWWTGMRERLRRVPGITRLVGDRPVSELPAIEARAPRLLRGVSQLVAGLSWWVFLISILARWSHVAAAFGLAALSANAISLLLMMPSHLQLYEPPTQYESDLTPDG